MKKHSTGKLTEEQLKEQDKIYDQKKAYDYIILGTGNAALTAGALLSNAGKKVCLLEAHDIPGGYAHTFKMGDYAFCAQVHYIWGCGPGGKIYEFLKKLGLEKDITFELYNSEGYDHMILPDNKRVKIPFGFDKLAENIEAAYPGQKANVEKFCKILSDIRKELAHFPSEEIKWWQYITKGLSFRNLMKYKNKTLQDVFDECKLSKEAQAVLCAQAGDFGSPPNELSIFPYAGLFGGYNIGAYYPTKHYKYYIERLVKFIKDKGGDIFYETPVTKINIGEGPESQITGIETKGGKIFTAKDYICNIDPQTASKMIGLDKFPQSFKKALSYKYSPAGVMLYIGLKKSFDPAKYGLGNHNTWHMTQWDMNKMWDEEARGDFNSPWWFMSTPTVHSNQPGIAPEGGHILEVATFTDYKLFKEAQDKSYSEYLKLKKSIADRLIELVEKHHIPDLREHIALKVIGSPTTSEDFVSAPFGNAYGSLMSPENMALGRLKAKTPWKNFFWCNASSGYAGIYGTVHTGVQLYMDLTGDKFYDSTKGPTDDEFIASLRRNQ